MPERTVFDNVTINDLLTTSGAGARIVASSLGKPIAATTNRIVTSVNLTNATLSIAAQPDVPRNITITVVDTTPSLTAGTVTVTGKAIDGTVITEVLGPLAAGNLTLTGTKIFASVTTVIVAGATVLGGSGDETIVVGVGNVIGLPSPINAAAAVKNVYLGGVYQTTPTVATGLLTSGVDVNGGTYASTKDLLVYFNPSL